MRCSGVGHGSHSLLNEYFSKKRFEKIMEIGVVDGEDARTRVTVALRNFSPKEGNTTACPRAIKE